MQKKKERESFESFYARRFGTTWDELKEALLKTPHTIPYSDGLLKPYYMDVASIKVGKAMPILERGDCLDMCAAPGGKTLVMTSMFGSQVLFQVNEASSNRRARLHRVLKEHLSEKKLENIKVTPYDAAKMARTFSEKFDRILLDAPCSSERHVMSYPSQLNKWSPSRIKSLSIRQWALLSSSFIMLKEGGVLVYSTCALLEEENDLVVQKLINKYNVAKILNIEDMEGGVEAFSINKNYAIKKKFGYAYLPHIHNGAGPIYFSLILKKALDDEW